MRERAQRLVLVGVIVIAIVAASGSAPFAESEEQSLQAQLDHVIQSWQPGWIADAPVVDRVPPSQLFRWRNGAAVITIDVRTMTDAPTALADVNGTPGNLSVGAVRADGIGDAAYVAGVPGGFTSVYVAVGNHIFVLSLHDVPDVAKSLSAQIVPILRKFSDL